MRVKVSILILFVAVYTIAQDILSFSFNDILQDIYEEQLEQERDVDFEQLSEQLIWLHENPININKATEDDLRQIPFLSTKQINDILLFIYQKPIESIYELQLVGSLAEYEVRNLSFFIKVTHVEEEKPFYWREMFKYGHHEISIRADARNIENNLPDPFYAYLKYRFNYSNKVELGFTMERDPKEPFYFPNKTYGADFYGGYFKINNLKSFKTIVLGDYKANFGYGMVLNTNMTYGGKTAYLTDVGMPKQGIQRKSSTAEYGFLRGLATTISLGQKIDITALYSARKADATLNDRGFSSFQTTGYHRTNKELQNKRSVWQHVAATNMTVKLKNARLGLTITEQFFDRTMSSDTLTYNENYFRGRNQVALGFNYYYHINRFSLFGEIATAQNSTWGIGNLTGARFSPANQFDIVAIYRYYSPHYYCLLANSFSESSKQNDENGIMVGIQYNRLSKVKIEGYVDYFHFEYPKYMIDHKSDGFDLMAIVKYIPKNDLEMQLKLRSKIKANGNKYSVRYTLNANVNSFELKTYIEGNLYKKPQENPTYGAAIAQSVNYSFGSIPITLQLRAEGFYTQTYYNRLYLYENDVLYAFSIPMLYGYGVRWYLNFRYHINKTFALYIKAAQTLYFDSWITQQDLKTSHISEVHAMLRIKI